MVTNSSREMQKDREKIRPPFGGLKFCQIFFLHQLLDQEHGCVFAVSVKKCNKYRESTNNVQIMITIFVLRFLQVVEGKLARAVEEKM